MISLAYVNGESEQLIGSDPYLLFENSIEEEIDNIDSLIEPVLELSQTYAFESGFLEEDASDLFVSLEAGSKNVFTKIGESIIAMGKKLLELINKVIGKITGSSKKAKKQEEEINKILKYFKKNDPKQYADLRNDVIAEFEAGTLTATDARSIKEFRAAYDELEKMAKDAKVDPKTLQGKVDAFKKKFDKIDQSRAVKTANASKIVIGAVAASIGLATTILGFKKGLSDNQKRIAEQNAEFAKAYEKMLNNHKEEYLGFGLSKAQIIQNLQLYIMHRETEMIRESEGKIAKLEKLTDSWIGMMTKRMLAHMKENRKKEIQQLNTTSERLQREEEEARRKKREENREDAVDHVIGNQDGNYQARQGDNEAVYKSNQAAKIEQTKKETKASETAKMKARDNYNNKHQVEHDATKLHDWKLQDQYNDSDDHQELVRKTSISQRQGQNYADNQNKSLQAAKNKSKNNNNNQGQGQGRKKNNNNNRGGNRRNRH